MQLAVKVEMAVSVDNRGVKNSRMDDVLEKIKR